jgi:ribosomal 50S subunit-recycling heat shock protein
LTWKTAFACSLILKKFRSLYQPLNYVLQLAAIEHPISKMELLARLEPRLDPNEALMPGLTERRTIELKTNDITSQVLGRGNITGISDHSIGKNVVQITFDEFSRDEQSVRATLLKDADHCKVHVNGMRFPETQRTTFLSSGDVISLDGLRYEYRLHISHFEGDMSTAKRKRKVEEAISISSTPSRSPETVAAAAAHSAQEGAVTLSSDMANKLSYEIQCSVCLDIQVYPRTLDPCGHSFCAVCLQKLTNCPQCRETINSHVPAMQLDSLICMLVSVPSLLDSDDVAHFHERKKDAKVVSTVGLFCWMVLSYDRQSTH